MAHSHWQMHCVLPRMHTYSMVENYSIKKPPKKKKLVVLDRTKTFNNKLITQSTRINLIRKKCKQRINKETELNYYQPEA